MKKSTLSRSDQLMHNTVMIQTFSHEGGGIGTGFFFAFKYQDNTIIPVIVTNKHVVKNANKGQLTFTTVSIENDVPQYGEKEEYVMNDFENKFIMHPDAAVDLCCLPLNPIIQDVKDRLKKELYIIYMAESLLPSQEEIESLSVLEDVIMIGYPVGLSDKENNLPIVRRGVTAIPPKFDFNGKTDIVIDMACFPGSSGSPICLYQEIFLSDERIHFSWRMKLLGILYAGPQEAITGEITVVEIPTAVAPMVKTKIMINIGYAVKSGRLLDFKPILEMM